MLLDLPLDQLHCWCKLQAQDLTCKAVCVSVHIWGFGSWYLARWFSRLLSATGRGLLLCVGSSWVGSTVQCHHNQDHSPKCCAKAGFLVMVHKWWCATSVPSWALVPCGRQEGNARAISLMEKLALPVWFHSVALAAIGPAGDRQDRAAEVTCHLPPFTLLFLLTSELPKQFPLRQFTQWP